jgi:hypothetical protein
VGRGEHHQGASRDSEHLPDGEVELVGYATGLIHYQESGTAKAPDSLVRTRQRHYPALILKLQGELALGLSRDGAAEIPVEAQDLGEQLLRLS